MTPKERDSEKKATLSGYGVALDLKKTDYLALDDRHLGTEVSVEMISWITTIRRYPFQQGNGPLLY